MALDFLIAISSIDCTCFYRFFSVIFNPLIVKMPTDNNYFPKMMLFICWSASKCIAVWKHPASYLMVEHPHLNKTSVIFVFSAPEKSLPMWLKISHFETFHPNIDVLYLCQHFRWQFHLLYYYIIYIMNKWINSTYKFTRYSSFYVFYVFLTTNKQFCWSL